MHKLVFVCAAIFILFVAIARAENKYVGVKVCASCHNTDSQGKMFDHWLQSRHSKAIQTLAKATESSPRKFNDLELWVVTMGRGDKYGLPNPAQESEHCLYCHATALSVKADHIASSFDPKDGIQCESCHGPGSGHVEMHTLINSGKGIPADKVVGALQIAKTAGFLAYEDERAIKAKCSGCHNGTCGDFDFDKMWPLIKHNVPKKN